mgnify:CR=1 FL=1
MSSYPKIKSVVPLSEKRLRVTFVSGDIKIYDCNPLISEDVFASLKDDVFFKNAHVDSAGYGVVWNDDVDLSEAELWINGVVEQRN